VDGIPLGSRNENVYAFAEKKHCADRLVDQVIKEPQILRRRAAEGGSWLAETSLRRIAAELLGMPRTIDRPADMPPDPAGHLQHFDVDGRSLTTAAPAIAYAGGPSAFAPPRPWGRDEPTWA